MQRLGALQGEVSLLEVEAANLRAAAVAGAAAVTPAIAAAEAEAEAAERGKWLTLVEAERAAGERRVAEVRAAGKAQYGELVRTIESRYVAEFEEALAAMTSRQAADAEELAGLEARLVELRAAGEAARAEKARLEGEASAAAAAAAGEAASSRAKLAALQHAVRAAWAARGVDTPTVAAFLRKLQSVLPYTPQLAKLYEAKVEQLRAAAPILRSVTRREVLLYRLEAIPRAIRELARASAAAAAADASPGAPAAAASLAAQRTAQMGRLREQYTEAVTDLRRVSDQLLAEVRAYEAAREEPFLYKGARLLDSLLADDAAAAAAAAASFGTATSGTSAAVAGGSPLFGGGAAAASPAALRSPYGR